MSELSQKDKEDLKSIGIDPDAPDAEETGVTQRSLLEVWQAVFAELENARDAHIDPENATRILRAWPMLKIQEIARYTELYYDHLVELRETLANEIAEAEEAGEPIFEHVGEEDGKKNAQHYLNLLTDWQVQVQGWSLDWESTDPEAHIRVAALADAQNFVLGQQGLIMHLDQIGFEFDDEMAASIVEALETAKAER